LFVVNTRFANDVQDANSFDYSIFVNVAGETRVKYVDYVCRKTRK